MASLDETGLEYLWEKIKASLNGKVDAITGKGLSANDYTTAEKNKLAGIEAGANRYAPTYPTASAAVFPEITAPDTWYYCSDSELQKYKEIRLWLEISDIWRKWVTLTVYDPGETTAGLYLSATRNARVQLKWDAENNQIGICVKELGNDLDVTQVSVKRMEYIR